MEEPLPEEFDIILIGTGLTESVLSGAFSRIGKSVLHIDQNKFYGGNWASFNIKDFDEFIASGGIVEINRKEFDPVALVTEDETFIPVSSQRQLIKEGSLICNLRKNKVTTASPKDVEQNQVPSPKPTSDNDDTTGSQEDQSLPTKIPDNSAPKPNAETIETNESLPIAEVTEDDNKSCGENVGDNDAETKTEEPPFPVAMKDEVKQTYKFPSFDEFYDQWRRFNVDLAPKVMFSRGKLVELLIQSNVSRYLEFRNVSRTLTLLSGQDYLQPVPCSRADVFSSKFVTVIEKRILMRVLTLCANYEAHPEEYEEFEDRLFLEFLCSKRLSEKAQQFILHSIAMVKETSTTIEGLKATKKFLQSLGRYGNSAFLWPMYGVGELPQAFSRLSAVFGGTFCLRRNAVGLVLNTESGKCTAIIDSQGQKIKCKHLIVDESNVPDSYRCEFASSVSRAVYVTDKSVLASDKEHVSLITLPPDGSRGSVRVIEAGPQCCVCPSKYHLVHALLSSAPNNDNQVCNPREKFKEVEQILFAGHADAEVPQGGDAESTDDAKPHILWSSYFDMMEDGVTRDALPSNLYVARGPGMELGFDKTMGEARELFERICPDDEFLPRAPDPEEIVFDDEGYNTESNGARVEESPEDGAGADYVDDAEDLREVEDGDDAPGQVDHVTRIDQSQNVFIDFAKFKNLNEFYKSCQDDGFDC
uniref:Rab proteins geranylgeranyltransferase component A 2 n=1 Tax=Phallusia mammillata TaxID=59560 RepID=A0A6F9D8N7_9ASCI|nr:rab proteins geranylgeranyltransferase component A 2 [Phallusia mammillata]